MTYARRKTTVEAWRVSAILHSDGEVCPDWLFSLIRRGHVQFSGDNVIVESKIVTLGDWIVNEQGFVRIYTNAQFLQLFHEIPAEAAATR